MNAKLGFKGYELGNLAPGTNCATGATIAALKLTTVESESRAILKKRCVTSCQNKVFGDSATRCPFRGLGVTAVLTIWTTRSPADANRAQTEIGGVSMRCRGWLAKIRRIDRRTFSIRIESKFAILKQTRIAVRTAQTPKTFSTRFRNSTVWREVGSQIRSTCSPRWNQPPGRPVMWTDLTRK